eukprot:11219127-Lingulodinium_polyedra.AAC.1
MRTKTEGHRSIGFPVPNDFCEKKVDRNEAKTRHCYNPRRLTWGKFNEENVALCKRRLEEGELVRNAGIDPGW